MGTKSSAPLQASHHSDTGVRLLHCRLPIELLYVQLQFLFGNEAIVVLLRAGNDGLEGNRQELELGEWRWRVRDEVEVLDGNLFHKAQRGVSDKHGQRR